MINKLCTSIPLNDSLRLVAKGLKGESQLYVNNEFLASHSSVEETSKLFHQVKQLKSIFCKFNLTLDLTHDVMTAQGETIIYDGLPYDVSGHNPIEVVRLIKKIQSHLKYNDSYNKKYKKG